MAMFEIVFEKIIMVMMMMLDFFIFFHYIYLYCKNKCCLVEFFFIYFPHILIKKSFTKKLNDNDSNQNQLKINQINK